MNIKEKEEVKEQNNLEGTCRSVHDHRPNKVQRRVISALSFFQLLKIANTLLKLADFNILLPLPEMRKIQVTAKTT